MTLLSYSAPRRTQRGVNTEEQDKLPLKPPNIRSSSAERPKTPRTPKNKNITFDSSVKLASSSRPNSSSPSRPLSITSSGVAAAREALHSKSHQTPAKSEPMKTTKVSTGLKTSSSKLKKKSAKFKIKPADSHPTGPNNAPREPITTKYSNIKSDIATLEADQRTAFTTIETFKQAQKDFQVSQKPSLLKLSLTLINSAYIV